MIDLEFLRGLIAAVDQSGIDSLEIERGGTRIRIAKSPAPANAPVPVSAPLPAPMPVPLAVPAAVEAPAPAPSPTSTAPPAEAPSPTTGGDLVEVKSPMVGTFYRAPSPEAPPYVEVGSRVTPGQTLCIIEAMKLMNELKAEVAGVVREICVENGEPVEYGQVLFRIEPL